MEDRGEGIGEHGRRRGAAGGPLSAPASRRRLRCACPCHSPYPPSTAAYDVNASPTTRLTSRPASKRVPGSTPLISATRSASTGPG